MGAVLDDPRHYPARGRLSPSARTAAADAGTRGLDSSAPSG